MLLTDTEDQAADEMAAKRLAMGTVKARLLHAVRAMRSAPGRAGGRNWPTPSRRPGPWAPWTPRRPRASSGTSGPACTARLRSPSSRRSPTCCGPPRRCRAGHLPASRPAPSPSGPGRPGRPASAATGPWAGGRDRGGTAGMPAWSWRPRRWAPRSCSSRASSCSPARGRPAGAVTIPLHAVSGRASGTAVADPRAGGWSILLSVHGLKDLGAGRYYECWYAGPGRPGHRELIAAGTFTTGRSGAASVTMWSAADPGQFPLMEITAEAPGGGGQHGVVVLAGLAGS